MTSADRRLDAVATGLTARERAIVAITCANRDEQPDERLMKYMPVDQHEEFNRLVTAVEGAVDQFWTNCIMWCEWIHQADIAMAWLDCLAALLARESQMRAALKAHGVNIRETKSSARRSSRPTVSLTPLPKPGRAFRRDVPLLLGTLVHEEPPPPDNWEAAIRFLSAEVREAVEIRWKELGATETVLGEMGDAFGGECCHRRLRDALDAVRRKLLELYRTILPFAGAFALPEPDEQGLASARGHVDWEALKSADMANPLVQFDQRSWLSHNDRAALDDIEARWKDEASSLKPSPARDIARGVPTLPARPRRRKARRRS